jgi:hypothetical protein
MTAIGRLSWECLRPVCTRIPRVECATPMLMAGERRPAGWIVVHVAIIVARPCTRNILVVVMLNIVEIADRLQHTSACTWSDHSDSCAKLTMG